MFLIDFTDDLPSRILEVIPGTMKLLHFLQKDIFISYGMATRYFVLIFFARNACLRANFGLDFALEIAFLIKISIRSNAMVLVESFTLMQM